MGSVDTKERVSDSAGARERGRRRRGAAAAAKEQPSHRADQSHDGDDGRDGQEGENGDDEEKDFEVIWKRVRLARRKKQEAAAAAAPERNGNTPSSSAPVGSASAAAANDAKRTGRLRMLLRQFRDRDGMAPPMPMPVPRRHQPPAGPVLPPKLARPAVASRRPYETRKPDWLTAP